MTKKEMKILEIFKGNLFSKYTIREMMKALNTRSYNWTYTAIIKLKKENILKLERKGKSEICSINLDEQKTIAYLAFLEAVRPKNIPHEKKIIGFMPSDFHILIVAGSYANNTQTKESDLDLVAIIDKREERMQVLNKLQREGELMLPPLHPFVFTNKEFLEMLAEKEENYGKEIFRKHIVITGAEFYFKLVKEAIDHGFKG